MQGAEIRMSNNIFSYYFAKRLCHRCLCLYVVLLALLIPGNLLAEERIDTAVYLGEVNVVAVKQEHAVRSEAVSATVVGRVALEDLNAVSMKGISDVVPNFFVPDYGSRVTSSMYVRGIGARMDQPAVGLNVDNVPILNKNGYDFDLADIESVEMLRGPQSTLYGRNTIGGLINISTVSPMRYQGWRLSASTGTGNDCNLSAGWYSRPAEKFATALIVSGSCLGGFFRNSYDGRLLDHELSGSLRWKADWRISGRVYLQNALSVSLLDQGGYPYEYVKTGEINYNDPCYYRRFLFTDGLTLRYRGEGFSMTSITTVQRLDDNMTLDQDFLPEPYFTLTQRQHETSVTEDIVFRGDRSDSRYHWLTGAFLFYKHLDMTAPVTFKDKGISSLIEDHRNSANPYYPVKWDTREFPLDSRFAIPAAGAALYHESRLELGGWRLTAGIRLDFETTALDYRSICHTGYEIFRLEDDGALSPERHVSIDIDDSDRLRRNYFNWMPKLGAVYSLPMEGENNVYGVMSRGYKAGGFNTQMFSDVLQQRLMGVMGIGSRYDVDDIVGYRPEYSWNFEVGSHLSFPSARLNIDVSLFYIDCTDQQLTMFPDGNTTGRIMTNAGRTRSFGGELSVSWTPVDRLAFTASYGYTNARFIDFFNGIENFSGKFVPYAPQNTLFIQGVWTIPLPHKHIKALVADVSMRGTGKIYWNEQNSLMQNFYALLGASLSLETKRWSLQVWGKNLTATRYYTFYFMSMGNEFLQRGRPVQAGVTFRINI